MKEDLRLNYNIPAAKVLYDRPSEAFRSISVQERHRLSKRIPEFKDPLVNSGTLFTEEFARDRVTLREDRPGLLVSSTSWTEDEDFGILLDALQVYNDTSSDNSVGFLPHLICVITGKGPMKDKYKGIIASRNWQHITVITPWLEPEDYPLMIASADLGVCLHTSSSGLDLPMKVVDMFGCGLPVAAVNYPTSSELIKNGENGIVFDTSYELAEIIMGWFKGFPEQTELKYNTFSSNLEEYQCLRWSDYWCTIARPVFKPE
uniref:Beta-1,4-mannosyltransferase n=1 Tax=Lepeophtheirus salmonis TaxID=72036 RepID=C1BUJ6_LEPSM|nr:glycosyltransferase ALG1-like [Lepeophtheirus salmonis]